MKQYQFNDVAAMQELVSEEFGSWSDEIEITQDLINNFAEMTGDDYWMHTDPEQCKTQSPFGSTIAHGFLTLVLLPKMRNEQTFEVVGFNNMLNYGSNKLLQEEVTNYGPDPEAKKYYREILRFCKTKGECSYYEAKLQFEHDVILRDDYYNEYIQCRINSRHIKKDEDDGE